MVRKASNGADMTERDKSKELSALSELWPFLRPYRMLMGAALLALILTAAVSLILPMAVRRVVDNFGIEDGAVLNQYFLAALLIAGLLAIGTLVGWLWPVLVLLAIGSTVTVGQRFLYAHREMGRLDRIDAEAVDASEGSEEASRDAREGGD